MKEENELNIRLQVDVSDALCCVGFVSVEFQFCLRREFLFRAKDTLTVAALAFSPIKDGPQQQGEGCDGREGIIPRRLVAALDGSVLVTRILCVEQRLSRHYAHENKINEP